MKNIFNCAGLDFRLMKPYIRSIFTTLALAVIFGAVMQSGTIMLTMGAVMSLMIVAYPFQIAEKSKMDTLYGTLPISRGHVVAGRYAFAVLFTMAMTAATMLGAIGIDAAFGGGTDIKTMFMMWVLLFSAFLLFTGLQFPIFFKYGVSKGKIVSYIPIFALGALIALVPMLGGSIDFSVVLTWNPALLCTAALTAGTAILVGSAFISYRIYSKKDLEN